MMKALWVMMIVTTLVILMVFFYAFIVMTSEQAVQIANEVQTVTPLPQQPVQSEQVNEIPEDQGEDFDDPVIFSFNRNDPAKRQELALKYHGMNDLDVMDRYLQRQDYIPILKRLWTENQSERRYNWLQEKRSESHPLLLFELALETVEQDPSLKGFTQALFLLEFAKDRTEMDTACVSDNSAEEAANSLYQIYGKAIADVVRKNPALYDEVQGMPQQRLAKEILVPLLAALKETHMHLDKLPSPNWVSQHALRKLFSNQDVMIDPKACRAKQEAIIESLLTKTERQLEEAEAALGPVPAGK